MCVCSIATSVHCQRGHIGDQCRWRNIYSGADVSYMPFATGLCNIILLPGPLKGRGKGKEGKGMLGKVKEKVMARIIKKAKKEVNRNHEIYCSLEKLRPCSSFHFQ